jgi:hypothetical protein
MKNLLIALLILIAVAGGYYFYTRDAEPTTNPNAQDNTAAANNAATTTDSTDGEPEDKTKTVIGSSVDGREITAYHYGSGDTELLFVGGIHGGYSWNTALVAYDLMSYLESTPNAIPANVKVTVIPVLNPDGIFKVVGTTERFTKADVPAAAETIAGRFNAHTVDLNRNFDCEWKAEGTWQKQTVSGGSAPFSEPESKALQTYVEAHEPAAAVVWYSAAGGVFSSTCHNGVSPQTRTLTNTYAKASGYKAYEDFDFYSITGDMVNWLAKKDIPAISVLLTTHTDVEWDKNKKGIDAVLKQFAE